MSLPRARGQQAHAAALGFLALDEFHELHVGPQVQLAALQLDHELREDGDTFTCMGRYGD